VTIGNSNAATIQYDGLVPGTVEGIFQINVVIPSHVRCGNQPVLVTIDGVPSQAAVTVAIK
jgi:uncharacterized protein (TIGR03437 family)